MREQEVHRVSTRIIKASELKSGMLFKQKESQRKFRKCNELIDLSDTSYIPNQDKLLVLYDNCRQWVVDPSQSVIVQNRQEEAVMPLDDSKE